MPLSTFQIAAIAVGAVAVGGVTAVGTGVIDNPFQAKQPAAQTASVKKSAPKVICRECGVVASIESFTEKGEATGGGAVAGGVVGAVVGNQIGKGRGKDLATVAGAVGGAVAGHEIEKSMKKVTRYRIGLRMDDGTQQTVVLDAANNVVVGDKVKLVNGALIRN